MVRWGEPLWGIMKATYYLEEIEWVNVWVKGAEKAEGLPRALFVGDSITQAYYDTVEKALGGEYRTARLTTSRCVADPFFQREMSLVLDQFPFALIHFNNGIHGAEYTSCQYADALASTMDWLRATIPQTRLAWAASTPIRCRGNLQELETERTEGLRERNRLAAEYMARNGIPVNDLFGAVIDRPDYYGGDGVHFNEAGVAALAEQVIRFVRGVM